MQKEYELHQSTAFFSICKLLLLVSLVIFLPRQMFGQDAAPDFGDGVFEDRAEEMESLLQLGVVNDRLRIQRGWELVMGRRKVDLKPEDEREKAIQRYQDRGVDRKMAERMVDRKMGMKGLMGKQIGDNAIWQSMEAYLKGLELNQSGGGGTVNGGLQYSFSSPRFVGGFLLENGILRFEFEERDANGRRFTVQETDDGQISLMFISANLIVDFRQREDKSVRLVIVGEATADVFNSETFSALVKQHPRAIKTVFFPLLQHLGVEVPVSDSDPQVRDVVMKRLVSNSNDDMQVLSLVDQLEADSHAARGEATQELQANYFWWQDLIKKNIADQSKSDDFKKRIRLITEGWPADEIHDFVQNNQLLESPEFLIGLLKDAKPSEKTLIVQQLEEVTGQELEEILEKWKTTQPLEQKGD